jgi:hypothetical protein
MKLSDIELTEVTEEDLASQSKICEDEIIFWIWMRQIDLLSGLTACE